MKSLWEIADFVRAARRQLRFGDLSRAPLRLLWLELRADEAECEWIARPADSWDADLPGSVSERTVAEQALRDTILVRRLLFSSLPGVATAAIRVYREGPAPELIIAGVVKREDPVLMGLHSLAMRVKLCGLQFCLDDGRLVPLQEKASR